MIKTRRNVAAEITFTSSKQYADPYNHISLYALITKPHGGTLKVPCFFAGGDIWKLRFSSPETGDFSYTTQCSDATNEGLHNITGSVFVREYNGKNPLYIHGPVKVSDNKGHMEHSDKKPFFWLGDTWWMGLTTRLSWPHGFMRLLSDRVKKGFSAIQIVMGLYPDMEPFDDKGANEAGFPLTKDYKSINPEYFDYADKKIQAISNSGLVPCIVACWGFFIKYAGVEALKKYWEYLIARYGAYPVVWCLAGEALMPFYLDEEFKDEKKHEEYKVWAKDQWTKIAAHVREFDPYKRIITIHPTQYGRDMIEDDTLIDIEMLQTGHASFSSLQDTVSMIKKATEKTPKMPVINSEVCYEGICGSSYQDVQRYLFYSCMLSGAKGFTYGANGIWQVNSRIKPYGPSPHGASWGDTPWEEAYKLPGSFQVGMGRKLLLDYEWWEFESHPEWTDNPSEYFASGIPEKIRVIFIPFLSGLKWEFKILKLEQGVLYDAYFFDPIKGELIPQGIAKADEAGQWTTNKVNRFQDWVIILKKREVK